MNGTCQQQIHCSRPTTFEHHLPFVLDNCLILWQHFRRWTIGSDKRSFHDETITSYIQVLEAIAVPTKEPDLCPSGSTKAARTLVRGLSSLIEKSDLSIFNQIQLASLLIHIRTICNNYSKSNHMPGRRCANSLSIFIDNLETSIANLCHDAERFCVLTKDLQVCAFGSYYCSSKLKTVRQHSVCGLQQMRGPLRLHLFARNFAWVQLRASRNLIFAKARPRY
jgi:hypothetical protein